MLGVQMHGTEKLMQALDPVRLRRETEQAVKDGGSIIQAQAISNTTLGTPLFRRDRALATSIRQQPFAGGMATEVGTNLPYGPVHEHGMTILPKKGKYLKFWFMKRGEGRLTEAAKALGRGLKKGEHVTGAAYFVQVPFVIIPRRPWLQPAHEKSMPRIMEKFRQAIQRSLSPR